MASFWTEADIIVVRGAIIALVSGESAQTISYGGNGAPTRTVTYYQKDLASLRALLAEMIGDVNGPTGTGRFRVLGVDKGC